MSASPGSAGLQPGSVLRKTELELGAPRTENPPGSSLQKAGQEPGAPGNSGVPGAPGWYSRGYLPHRDEIGLLQFITYRLADSLPQEKLRQLEATLATLPADGRDLARRKQIETWLDAGLGCCALRHPALARTVEAAFFHADGTRYRLLAWCVMPNHVHVLIRPHAALAEIVRAWKSYTGRWAMAHNAELELGVPGKTFWQREYWDRFIRDENHLHQTIDYIHHNPVKAGLCAAPEHWRHSSAAHGRPGSAELPLGSSSQTAGQEPGAPSVSGVPGSAGLPPGSSFGSLPTTP